MVQNVFAKQCVWEDIKSNNIDIRMSVHYFEHFHTFSKHDHKTHLTKISFLITVKRLETGSWFEMLHFSNPNSLSM